MTAAAAQNMRKIALHLARKAKQGAIYMLRGLADYFRVHNAGTFGGSHPFSEVCGCLHS